MPSAALPPLATCRVAALGVVLACAVATSTTSAQGGRYDEPWRPRVHFTPAQYFMNDPNGLVYYKGEYHLFYQHNPFGPEWGHMSWGHAVSRDMLHWEHLPVALREEDGVMIFSGSAVVDWKNTSGLCRPTGDDPSCLVAIYTGHTSTRQHQNIAVSHDRGRTWTKYPGNPVIDLGLKDFRDPKVFWHEPTHRWIMAAVLPDQHKVRFFASADLKKWDTLSDFGPAGATGGVWECPDLFPLEVEGEPGTVRWVLDVDINPGAPLGGSGGQYFVGSFDGTRFVNDNPPDRTLWVDYGKDFYATTSFSDLPASDHRRIWMGWISNWLYANQEPTAIWRGAQSLPRALALRRLPDGLRLVQHPIAEVGSLRTSTAGRPLTGRPQLPPSADITFSVRRGTWKDAGLRFANTAGEETIVSITSSPLEVVVDKQRSRSTPWHKDAPGRHAGPVRWRDEVIAVRVVFDRSVIEVFVNDGETVLTERVYPMQPYTSVSWVGDAPAAATLWELRSVWQTEVRQ